MSRVTEKERRRLAEALGAPDREVDLYMLAELEDHWLAAADRIERTAPSETPPA